MRIKSQGPATRRDIWGKQERPTYCFLPPVTKYEPGKVTLVKAPRYDHHVSAYADEIIAAAR